MTRIGPRLLVCPSCTMTLYDAGPGRGFCTGNQNPPNAMQPHPEIEMVAYAVERPDNPPAIENGEDE